MGIKKLFNFKGSANLQKVKEMRIDKNYGGIIHQLNLDEFWHSLQGAEKAFIRNRTSWSFGGRIKSEELDDPKSNAETKRSVYAFLLGNASWASEAKEYELAEKLLNEVIKRTNNIFIVHRCYKELIVMHHKLSKQHEGSLEKCIEFSKFHIEIAPLLFENAMNTGIEPPRIAAFNIMMKMYEEKGLLEEYEKVFKLEQQYKNGTFE
ncbi:hypothetical protein JOC75_003635 [Metabacillus crassostreae]|uniref:hypothetical protein n=1 Tax=Metabacillus crassostreae TaxID=929098 RepID=UPI00195E6957|nr:hypothetical protein [Metabacillus crassostreae]MBM7605612.1 hypothetical protein [Metabacillus crassostreae]